MVLRSILSPIKPIIKQQKGGGRKTLKAHSIAEFDTKLLNDEGETSRDFVEHGIAETPMGFWWDLLLRILNRHLQLQ